jgi:hypothetical protein
VKTFRMRMSESRDGGIEIEVLAVGHLALNATV